MESVDLLDGSFKGIDFYVKGDEGLTTFGRKLAIQEYPNTSEQFAEDVGGFARNFNLTIFWTGSRAVEDSQSFMRACEFEGFGLLVLPILGVFTVKAGECKINYTPNETINYVEATVSFHESRKEAGFVEDLDTLNQCLQSAYDAQKSMTDLFDLTWLNEYTDLLKEIAVLTDVEAMISSMIRIARTTTAPLREFFYAVDLVSENINFILEEDQLATQMDRVYTSLSAGLIGYETKELLDTITSETDNYESTLSTDLTADSGELSSQSSETYWPNDTPTRVERNRTRQLMAEYHRASLVNLGYQTLPSVIYDTDSEAIASKKALELSYQKLFIGETVIIDGQPLIDTQEVSDYLTNTAVFDTVNRTRKASLVTQEKSENVRFKIEKVDFGKLDVNIHTASYLTEAEKLNNELDLIDFSRVLRDQNGRATYNINGEFEAIRRVL